jgi:hypothetical protein
VDRLVFCQNQNRAGRICHAAPTHRINCHRDRRLEATVVFHLLNDALLIKADARSGQFPPPCQMIETDIYVTYRVMHQSKMLL